MGKHGVRNEVLNKPGRLSQGERCEMQQHAGLTENILDKITFPAHLRDVPVLAAYHHEKMDGSGPYGLAGEAIPLEARIISVADAFDALLSPRVYKKALPLPEVMDLMHTGAGKEWDPEVVEVLTRLLPELLARIYPGREGDVLGTAEAA
jgi:HD-GYP domain-containing protein (c-di-GMP phosphodiesterase class II)